MRSRIIVAFVLLLIGVIRIIDSIIFDIRTSRAIDLAVYHQLYKERFPDMLQPFTEKPFILVFFLCFAVAGIIYIQEKKKVFFVIGIVSFVLAIWHLFTLM